VNFFNLHTESPNPPKSLDITNLKKALPIAISVLTALSAQAEIALIVDEWTFTNATTPQISDIKNKSMSTWATNLAGNSWAGDVLTWGYTNTTPFVTSSNVFYGDPNLGVGTIPQLKVTIDTKDINFSENGGYGWEFTAPAGGITNGSVRFRITSFNDIVIMKMQGATTNEVSSTTLYNQTNYTSITDLQLTYTWDLVNDTMLMTADGSGVLATGGTGTISYSNSFAQDLSGIVNLTGFRTRQQGQGTSFMQLDAVTIEVIPEPSTVALVVVGLTALGSMALRRRR
jgi:hypothetical protein